MSGLAPNNVTVINHLNFSPTLLTDGFLSSAAAAQSHHASKSSRSSAASAAAAAPSEPSSTEFDPLFFFSNSFFGGSAAGTSGACAAGATSGNNPYNTSTRSTGTTTSCSSDLKHSQPLLQQQKHHHQSHHNHQLQLNNGASPSSPDDVSPPAPVVSSSDPWLHHRSHGLLAGNNQIPLALPDISQDWLQRMEITVSAISVDPITGADVIHRVHASVRDVLTCYIPCVDFLVQCQQDLRKGLQLATQKRRIPGKRYYEDTLNPQQFLATYIEPLPHKFLSKVEHIMETRQLEGALIGLQSLVGDAKKVQLQGCESVKNTFLGGMKDGESWGLRKWLSRNGNALKSCTELECILGAVKQLDRQAANTQRLTSLLRPMAQIVLERLKTDIPVSYQEVSAAHPYLPFFHRLEAALRGMATYDPTEDDVICIDDSDDDDDENDEVVVVAPVTTTTTATAIPKGGSTALTSRRKRDRSQSPSQHRQSAAAVAASTARRNDSSATLKATHILKAPPPQQQEQLVENDLFDHQIEDDNDDETNHSVVDSIAGSSSSGEEESVIEVVNREEPPPHRTKVVPNYVWPIPVNEHDARFQTQSILENIERLARLLESNGSVDVPKSIADSWDRKHYVNVLQVLISVLRHSDCYYFIDRVEDDVLVQAGRVPFGQVVRHPIGLREICEALTDRQLRINNGKLYETTLTSWNMWRPKDLLHAIDLVFLNALAYAKKVDGTKSKHRSTTNKLRRVVWAGVEEIMAAFEPELKRKLMPIRRTEASGFILINKD